jgi:glycosyltransferase involved in cell wall biosynthesis
VKILHVVSSLSSEHGGPPVFVKQLAIAHQQMGHTVAVLTASEKDYYELSHLRAVAALLSAGVHVISLRTKNLYRFSFELMRVIPKLIDSYDMVHVHSIYRFPVDFAIFYAAIKSKPYILSPHGSLDPYLYKQSALGWVGLAVKKIYHLVFSVFIGKAYLHFTTVNERKVCAIPVIFKRSFIIPIGVAVLDVLQGYNYKIRTSINASQNDIIVAHVGRFHPKKNLLNLIKAFHQAFALNHLLWLILIGPNGDDLYMQILHKEAKAGLGQHRIIFWGEVPHETVTDYLADIDIFCLPSHTENFGIALIEAMASCKPVIITENVNIHELVTMRNAGVISDTDVSSICDSLLMLSSASPELRTQMGCNGLNLVKEYFSPQVISNQYLEAYRYVASA